MGGKGKKKKAKVTGTPDVVKFKGTREFYLLQESVSIQESLPFVAVDALDEQAFKKVARFLNMVGLLAEFLHVQSNKDYRFNYHYKYLAPIPQFFPFGFNVEVIRAARQIQERPGITYNNEEHKFPENLRTLSEKFLKDVDSYMTKIASEIEPRLKDDFATGLKRFKFELKEDLEVFEELWTKYELEQMKATHEIMSKVFGTVDKIITVERMLSQAEERLDIEIKQRLENELVYNVEEFCHVLFPETRLDTFPDEVIPLAEACIFYESKCTDEWLHQARYLIKEYLELRNYVKKIPEERLYPNVKENPEFLRLLKNFWDSVSAAKEALLFVAKLPKLIHAKTSDWMTDKMMEPDLRYIQQTAALALQG